MTGKEHEKMRKERKKIEESKEVVVIIAVREGGRGGGGGGRGREGDGVNTKHSREPPILSLYYQHCPAPNTHRHLATQTLLHCPSLHYATLLPNLTPHNVILLPNLTYTATLHNPLLYMLHCYLT